jgi:Mn-dependent DtxR family transcriptional regulator
MRKTKNLRRIREYIESKDGFVFVTNISRDLNLGFETTKDYVQLLIDWNLVELDQNLSQNGHTAIRG